MKILFNPYQTKSAKILKITDQAPGVKLFEFKTAKPLIHRPGQIIELSIPGFGEGPFAPCNKAGGNLELCVRAVGKLTVKLHSLKKGNEVGVRGPFGNGWPSLAGPNPAERGGQFKKNVLIVVGGLGLVPLRTLIFGKDRFFGEEAVIQIFYGAKSPEEFLFRDDFDKWRKAGIDLQLTVDKECADWQGCVGLVTTLFDKKNIAPNAKAFLCGPPVMYKFALKKVKEYKFKDEDIYLSFERRMHCGVGVCQHCAVGPYYTCKNGPVFKYSEIKDIQGAI